MESHAKGPKNRREHARSTTSEITVHFNGETHSTRNWSPGGFSVDEIIGIYAIGDFLSGSIKVFNSPELEPFNAEITRISSEGSLAAKFTELSAQGYLNMCDLINNND